MNLPAHRHELTTGHEHEFEAELGLPEPLPEGERILWQGSPDPWRMAVERFHVRKIAWYFAALLLLRVLFLRHDGVAWGEIGRSVLLLGALAVLALAMLGLVAFLSARGSLYTVTDRRVVMRLGIVLTLTFNLPFKALAGASVHAQRDGHGDVALTLAPGDKIAWFHLWPHARPWEVARPQPQLSCLPDAAAVAALLREAWIASCGVPRGCTADVPAVEVAPAGAGDRAAPAEPTRPAAAPARRPVVGAIAQGARG